ncbi:MAG: type II toxin-antitoxin system VapC family toxin [Actinomycetota bacterium]|nr:type II toxin-antitoxin system VapC family toxin [Actinomycetota bacterium]
MTTYVDASVLLRVVLAEPEPLTEWSAMLPVSSELIRVECLRVIERARFSLRVSDEQSARHRADVLEAIDSFGLSPVTGSVLERASDPFPTSLGTLDAIHLATALELRTVYPDMTFATHDRELATAARSVGFSVLGIQLHQGGQAGSDGGWPSVPGYELVPAGLLDLKEGRSTVQAALVRSASKRLAALGFDVPAWPATNAPDLYQLVVEEVGEGRAHSRYNALRRRLASFLRTAKPTDAKVS